MSDELERKRKMYEERGAYLKCIDNNGTVAYVAADGEILSTV